MYPETKTPLEEASAATTGGTLGTVTFFLRTDPD